MNSSRVMKIVDAFMQYHQWARWGQFIGVHPITNQQNASSAVSEFLSLAKELTSLPMDGESMPRFYISTTSGSLDLSPQEAAAQDSYIQLQQEIWDLNLIGAKGTAIMLHSHDSALGDIMRNDDDDAGRNRNRLYREIADFYMLSKTSLIVGSRNREMARLAALAGDTFIILV